MIEFVLQSNRLLQDGYTTAFLWPLFLLCKSHVVERSDALLNYSTSGVPDTLLPILKCLSATSGRKGSENLCWCLCFKSSSVPWLLRMEVFSYQKTNFGWYNKATVTDSGMKASFLYKSISVF